jgi:Ricin-type beta-trefoil lectin domain-like
MNSDTGLGVRGLVALTGLLVAQGFANTANAQFEIVSYFGNCVDIQGASEDNRADAIVWECNGQDNQRFYADCADDACQWFVLSAAHSGKCLDVQGASSDWGADVIQWECNGQHNQQWGLVELDEGTALVSRASGLCLDIRGGDDVAGADVIQWNCHYGTNQLWYFF